jgi:hypothetical protein
MHRWFLLQGRVGMASEMVSSEFTPLASSVSSADCSLPLLLLRPTLDSSAEELCPSKGGGGDSFRETCSPRDIAMQAMGSVLREDYSSPIFASQVCQLLPRRRLPLPHFHSAVLGFSSSLQDLYSPGARGRRSTCQLHHLPLRHLHHLHVANPVGL